MSRFFSFAGTGMIKYAVSATIDGKAEYLRKSRNKLQFGLSINALHDDRAAAEAELKWCYEQWRSTLEHEIYRVTKAAEEGRLHGGFAAASEYEAKCRTRLARSSFCVVRITFESLPAYTL